MYLRICSSICELLIHSFLFINLFSTYLLSYLSLRQPTVMASYWNSAGCPSPFMEQTVLSIMTAFKFLVWPMVLSSVLLKAMIITIFPQSGMYEHWATALMTEIKLKAQRKRKQENATDTESSQEEKDAQALTLIHMQGAFMLLLIGLTFATLVFLMETVHSLGKPLSNWRHTLCCGRKLWCALSSQCS